MGHKIGDTVRLRDGSDLCELLEPWDEATGEVTALFNDADGLRISVRFGDAGPIAMALSAADFVADRPLDGSPF